LVLFNNNLVKYLVVGGYAVIKHGRPRFTGDIDIWIEPNPQNAESVYKSLKEFGAPVSELTVKDFSEPGFFFQMGIPPCRIDILMSVTGGDFAKAYRNRAISNLDIGPVPFIGLEDLIAVKIAAGRPKDLADVAALKKIVAKE